MLRRRRALPPAAKGPCLTCEAARELRRDPAATCSWCLRGLGRWRGSAEFFARVEASGALVRRMEAGR